MSPEKVIFRAEKNPYFNGDSFLAVFPETASNPGMLAALPFHYENGIAIFEPFTEISRGYYYKTRIIHARSVIVPKLIQTISERYHDAFVAAERILR